MVTFDAQDPGTASSEWLQDPRWHLVRRLALDDVQSLLVLAAHPDDETLGAGGLISTARAAGLPVTIVVVTDGAEAGGDSATRRAAEARQAAARLGVDDIRLLGFADGRVRENRAAITDALRPLTRQRSNALVVAPWQGDGHRDHRVLGEIAEGLSASRGLALWAYPIWLWHWAAPADLAVPWVRFGAVSLSNAARTSKARALACYPSQTTGSPPMLQPRFLAHFARGEEVFVVPISATDREFPS